jgi:type 1 glutamine amidotransferase
LILASGAGLLATGALGRLHAEQRTRKRVLFFTKSSGFQHSVVFRSGGQLAHAERILMELGSAYGYEVLPSKDGRLFEPDRIGEWDAFVFFTTGDLTRRGDDGRVPMTLTGKHALLGAIRSGKGFIGLHSASDTFHSRGDRIDPYLAMLGGEFITHGAEQVARVLATDELFPGIEPFVPSRQLLEEWYALKNMPADLHVLLAQDTNGMRGPMYQRPNYPMTWIRRHGDGRVFYTSMGHREDVWEDAGYQRLLLGALDVVCGQAGADFTPNVAEVTPGYMQLPP